MIKHKWYTCQSGLVTYTECSCGFQPYSQEEYDQHTKETTVSVPKPNPSLFPTKPIMLSEKPKSQPRRRRGRKSLTQNVGSVIQNSKGK